MTKFPASGPSNPAPLSARLNAERAAEYVGLSPATLAKYRSVGGGPMFIKLGARVVYNIADLDAWMRSRTYSSTAEALAS